MQWPLKKNSGNGCGNEDYASHLKQEIIYILYFTEINSTNLYWCKSVNLFSKITYISRKELFAKLTSFWSGAELLLLIQWFAIHLWERSAEQFLFKDCWSYDFFHKELQKNKGSLTVLRYQKHLPIFVKDWSCLTQKQINNPKSRIIPGRLLLLLSLLHLLFTLLWQKAETHSKLVSHNAECYMNTGQDKTSSTKK